MNASPCIAIIGTGAVGGYYGGRLAQHGHDVHFLLRSDYDYVREHGLHVRSIAGDFSLSPRQLHLYKDPAAMPAVDLVIVALKSTENRQFARLITPLLHPDTAILTLQNGLGNEDDLAQLFGANRVLGGIAFTCINRTSPGVIEHLDHGFIRLGEFERSAHRARLESIARMFTESNVPGEAIDDLRAARWDKLVWNIPFNGLGALLDRTTDRLLDSPGGERIVRAIMKETIAAARADGIALSSDVEEKKIALTRTMGAYRSSMQLDRQSGRALEVEAIIGRPLRIAQAAQVPCPLVELLYFALTAESA